tara:strand:+ start:13327 stop:15015 length:1689 start_codon:yes stop_codon:yes gene_type:complete
MMADRDNIYEYAELASQSSVGQFRQRLAEVLIDEQAMSIERALHFARLAAKWREYEAVAQIICIGVANLSKDPATELFDEAADLLFEALENANMTPAEGTQWVAAALRQLQSGATIPGTEALGEELNKRVVIPTRTAQLYGLMRQSPTTSVVRPRTQKWAHPVLAMMFAAAPLVAVLLGAHPPMPTTEHNLLPAGLWLAMVWLWIPLLLSTWAAMAINAARTGARRFVPPEYLFKNRRIITGHHQGFDRDVFFHVFAFIWIPLLGVLALAESQLPAFLSAIREPHQSINDGMIENLLRAGSSSIVEAWARAGIAGVFFNTRTGYVAATLMALFSLRKQSLIQNERIASSIDIYWWDIRLGRPVWVTRWLIVGVTMFFATIAIQKIGLFLTISTLGAANSELSIDLLHPDGVAGMSGIRDAINTNAWVALIFGVLVLSSWYLHQGLPQYQWTDRAMGMVYALIVVCAVVLPFYMLTRQVDMIVTTTRNELIENLSTADLDEPTKFLAVHVLRSLKISLIDFNSLNNPIFILIAQSILLGARAVRATKARNHLNPDRWRTNEAL